MKKPIKPIEPNSLDKVKYPDSEKPLGKNFIGDKIRLPHPQFIKDWHNYAKALANYEIDVQLCEQLKFIKFIKVANENLILKKYKITKI